MKKGYAGSDNALGIYLKQISKKDLLSREEERDLAKRVSEGDEGAKVQFIEKNLRLVVSVAKRYQNNGLPLPDLIGEGNFGLLEAVERFDYNKGCRFTTYATWWIRQAIVKALSEKSRTIRLPMHMLERVKRIKNISSELEQELGCYDPPSEDIAERMGESVDYVNKVLNAPEEPVSLDAPILSGSDDASSPTRRENICDPYQEGSITDRVGYEELKRDLDSALDKILTEREAGIIRYRRGLNGGIPMTLEETGLEYGITRERVRQIEVRAIGKLRNSEELAKVLRAHL